MATYYVNASGNNANDGLSSGNAFANFNPVDWNGSNPVSAGDTVIVEDTGGEIVQSTPADFYNIQGSSGSPVTIKAADGQSPVVNAYDGASARAVNIFKMELTAYFVIDGLEMKNAENANIWMGSANENTFKNLDLHHAGTGSTWGSNLEVQADSTNILIQDCVAHHGAAGGNSDGFSLDGTGTTATFERCDAYLNGDDGFDFWNSAPSTATDCRAWGNGEDPTGTQGNGDGFKVGGDGAGGGNTLERCIAFNNSGDSGRGFDNNNAATANTIHNCVAWSNDVGYRHANSGISVEYRNCVEYQNTQAFVNMSYADDQFNTWNLSISDPDWADVSLTTGDEYLGPVNDSTFMTLNSGSPCIDAGTDVGLSYNGTAPDVNAYEYVVASSASNTLYNNFKELLFSGGIDLDGDTIQVALISDSPAYSPDIDGEVFLGDVLDGGTTATEVSGTGYSRETVPMTVAQDNANDRATADTSDLAYTGLDAGTVDGILGYKSVTNAADSPLVAYLTSADFPLTTNGGDVTIQWDSVGVVSLG